MRSDPQDRVSKPRLEGRNARLEGRCGIFRSRRRIRRSRLDRSGRQLYVPPVRSNGACRSAALLFGLFGNAAQLERFRTMHAVIRTGGKQYRVAAQEVIRIEKIAGDEGEIVLFDQVLAVGNELGAPLVSGASVAGRVVAQARADKIIVFKKKRRQNYRRKQGHRQDQTIVRIEEILTGGKKPAATKAAPEKKAKKKTAKKAQEAEEQPAKAAAPAAAPVAAAPAADDAPMFARPDGEPDDLKKLPGVGPATEKKLNALGIARYAQIAAFTAAEIETVDAALNLKGKIEQDDWPALAKELAGDD